MPPFGISSLFLSGNKFSIAFLAMEMEAFPVARYS